MSIYKRGHPNRFHNDPDEKLPAAPGEYRIRDINNKIIYIGETNNIARRAREHQYSGKLDFENGCTLDYMVADRRSSSRTRRKHEQFSIAKHQPTLNRSCGGEGRPAKRKSAYA